MNSCFIYKNLYNAVMKHVPPNSPLQKLKKIDKENQLLSHTSALLGWDQETYMPRDAIKERAGQQALLSGILHDRQTDSEAGLLLEKCGVSEGNLKGDSGFKEKDRAFLRQFAREYYRAVKLPKDLVVEFSKEASLSQAQWIEARKQSDFSLFAPHLQRILDLTREKAEKIGYTDHPYDALLDEFEPFATTASVKTIFGNLKPELTELVRHIAASDQVDADFLLTSYPTAQQKEFGHLVLKDLGFDFNRGRLDVSAHPFTTSTGSDDVRLTTRYNENQFVTGIFGIIHEGGHGLYELGFSEDLKVSILAQGTSLGIHESQSRTWENIIGRSLPFWTYYFPKLKEFFPGQLNNVSLEAFYKGINKVEPSMIRVEADEVTYSLHIILRFELECALVSGELAVKDLPEAWNNKMEELLGIRPCNDAEGVLQDVHWSFGAIGYFPTYALGNLYGAQFFNTMNKDLGDVDSLVARGEFKKILGWLRENIHRHGSSYTAEELCTRVTGEPLNPEYFSRYLTEKYRSIYKF